MLPSWEKNLAEVLEEAKNKTFRYGKWDCCTFTNKCVKAVTGKDCMRDVAYKNKAEAMMLVKKIKGIAGYLDSFLNRIDLLKTSRGDVVIDTAGTVGICLGNHAVSTAKKGLERMPRNKWSKAWSVRCLS